jgi:hypothetical protein
MKLVAAVKMKPTKAQAAYLKATLKAKAAQGGGLSKLERVVHLAGIDDSVSTGGPSRICHSCHKSMLSAWSAVGVNPAPMRSVLPDLNGRISRRLAKLHRCNDRLSMNGN